MGFGKKPKSKKSRRNDAPEKPKNKSASTSSRLMEAALDDLKRSTLTKRDFEILQLEILTPEETDDFVGEPRGSYRIPYFTLEGKKTSYSRVRFLENKKGKFSNSQGSFRYSQPANSSPHVYFPPYLKWEKIARDPSQRIVITEGEKKAALACKLGIPTIALGGVYAFKSSKRLWDLIPEMQAIKWKDREVEICFDADVMWKVEVRQALSMLAFTLTQEQGPKDLNFVFLDAETAGPKTGLDDYLAEHGKEGFEKLPRSSYMANEKIQLINQRVTYVEQKMKFFDMHVGKYFKNLYHVRESFLNMGEAPVDGKRTVPVVDLWSKSANRRTVNDVIYVPGEPELVENNLNIWKAPDVKPVKGNPKRWLDLVNFIFSKPSHAEWFLKWLAYPVQKPGTKLFQSVFVYGEKQGVGKTFVVDPVMEAIYGKDNFHRLGNNSLTSQFNSYAAARQFVVTNEVWLPDFRDRKMAMGMLKDIITREKVTVNEKFQPEVTYMDYCNYYFTSNHADALALEKNDRRFFVIEAPTQKLSQADYYELDKWIRELGGASVIMHYLQNSVDLSDFDPKGDALMTPWKKQIIELSRDALAEYGERVITDPDSLFMMNGSKPDMELFRAEDLLRNFELKYPKYRFNVTVKRMARLLKDERLEKRNVRVSADGPLMTLYAVFNRGKWNEAKNRDWANHYIGVARQFAALRRKRSH